MRQQYLKVLLEQFRMSPCSYQLGIPRLIILWEDVSSGMIWQCHKFKQIIV